MRKSTVRGQKQKNDVPLKIRDSLGSDRLIGDFFRFYMIILLYESPKTGYEIMTEISQRLGKKVSPSIVYPFLKSLERKKFISPKTMSTGDRERNVNSLTGSGRAMASRLFKQFTSLVSVAIEPNMVKCANCGVRVFSGGYHEYVKGKERSFCCEFCASDFKRQR
jgi:DNA-binding PadR family transcriptional regulator